MTIILNDVYFSKKMRTSGGRGYENSDKGEGVKNRQKFANVL